MGDHKKSSNLVAVSTWERYQLNRVLKGLGEIKGRDQQRLHGRTRKALKLKSLVERIDQANYEAKERIDAIAKDLADGKVKEETAKILIMGVQSKSVFSKQELDVVDVYEIQPDVRDYLLKLADGGLAVEYSEELEDFLFSLENLKAGLYQLPEEFQDKPATNGEAASPPDAQEAVASA